MLPNNPIVAQVLLKHLSARKDSTTDNTDGHGSEKTRMSACLYPCSSELSVVRNLLFSRLCVGSGGPRRLDRTLQLLEILIRFVHSCPNAVVVELPRHPRPAARSRYSGLAIIAHHSCPSFQMTEKSKWARNFPMLRKNSHSCPNSCHRLFNQKEFRLG